MLNLLSDTDHPLQALADLLTVKQLLGRIEGARIAYVGDADNNVARSLAQACVLAGAELTLASPEAYALADAPYGVRHVVDPAEAVDGRRRSSIPTSGCRWARTTRPRRGASAFAPYQVDEALMAKADDAFFLHCLPARRGEEVTHGVIESARSAVWRQAENRMHTARGALAWLAGSVMIPELSAMT